MKFTTSPHFLPMALLAVTGAIVPVHAAGIPNAFKFERIVTVVGATATTLTLEADMSDRLDARGSPPGSGRFLQPVAYCPFRR